MKQHQWQCSIKVELKLSGAAWNYCNFRYQLPAEQFQPEQRPLTVESTDVFRALEQAMKTGNKKDKIEFVKKFRIAQKAHNTVVKECLGAAGFDRHLSALKYHAMQNNINVRALYSQDKPNTNCIFKSEYLFDPVLADINKFHISTSTLDGNMLTQGTNTVIFTGCTVTVYSGGFGPVTEGGFGIGYIISPDWAAVFVHGFEVLLIYHSIYLTHVSQSEGAFPDKFCEKIKNIWNLMQESIELESNESAD